MQALMVILVASAAPAGYSEQPLLHPEKLPVERVSVNNDWRNALVLPKGENRVLELGLAPERGVLRIGVAMSTETPARPNIEIYAGVSGTVRAAVEAFKRGQFSPLSGPSVSGHFGTGQAGGGDAGGAA